MILPYSKRGIFEYLFSYKAGASPPIQRMDIRLGGLDSDFAGIPLWLLLTFVVGFIYSYFK